VIPKEKEGLAMKCVRKEVTYLIVCLVFVFFASSIGWAGELPHPTTYILSKTEVEKHKRYYDDPRPVLETQSFDKILPKELYEHLTYDIDKMKETWEKCVGFKSTDQVGKIHPEIKPGKYTWKDVKDNPAFKELTLPRLYERIAPGGPPFAGNIAEFEIVPPRQYYWALPIAEATLRNIGKTKQDEKGYIVPGTWEAGYPFPRPSGEFAGQQLIYNFERKYYFWGKNSFHHTVGRGYRKDLTEDDRAHVYTRSMRFTGRCLFPPYGALDDRAKKRGEIWSVFFGYYEPRDSMGTTLNSIFFEKPDKNHQQMLYIPGLRRVRRMSGTDAQDKMPGMDATFDDGYGFSQKISPDRYPYKYEIIEDREFLVWSTFYDGSVYLTSKEKEFRNVKLERRPCLVLKMTQLDPGYIYGARYMVFDKETFHLIYYWVTDQKGRLYYDVMYPLTFTPEMGMYHWNGSWGCSRDHVDIHSSANVTWQVPAYWKRTDVSLKSVFQQAK
jgi:uncharacterized protein DUF1329